MMSIRYNLPPPTHLSYPSPIPENKNHTKVHHLFLSMPIGTQKHNSALQYCYTTSVIDPKDLSGIEKAHPLYTM